MTGPFVTDSFPAMISWTRVQNFVEANERGTILSELTKNVGAGRAEEIMDAATLVYVKPRRVFRFCSIIMIEQLRTVWRHNTNKISEAFYISK